MSKYHISSVFYFNEKKSSVFVNISAIYTPWDICRRVTQILNSMDKNAGSLFLFVFGLTIHMCFSDLTGAHYLRTINCSSLSLYIPQGPYLFSHHWPFTSITIHYQKQLSRGTCYRDGSLHFVLNDGILCSGIYYGGQAKLLCRFKKDEYCLIDMKTSDGRRLTCDGSKLKSRTIVSIVSLVRILFICKNSLFD